MQLDEVDKTAVAHNGASSASLDRAGIPDRRRRVLVISEPGFAGVKRHVCHLLRSLIDSDFQAGFVYSLGRADASYETEIQSFQQQGIDCFHVPMVRQISPLRDARAALQIWNIVRRWKPDIVHCHSAKAGFLGRVASKTNLHQAATVYTPHAMPCYFSKKYKIIEQAAGRLTNYLVAVSESEKEDFITWKIVPESRMRVLPLAVDSEVCENIHRDNDHITIGACGRICEQKRSLFFFELGCALMIDDPRIRLKWIGDFSDDAEAEAVRMYLRGSPFADRIEITGWVSDTNAHIAGLDLFCMFSRYESFGFVTADAMLLGVPVVAIDGTGTRDLVKHGVTGLICDGTIQSGVHEIKNMLQNESLRTSLIDNARQHIQSNFSPSRADAALHGFYKDVTGSATIQHGKPR
jgi:glycosyltransferase involved in cell wall biosynthesis